MITRRIILAGLAAGALAPVVQARAHTLYPQWVAYRRKHLLIGCHRKDPETFRLAEALADGINHALPKAKARVARAPHPERLASLIGTDQMEIAVLPVEEAILMRDGAGAFAAYGKLALTRIAGFDRHVLVADAGFPQRHAWMVSAAVEESGLAQQPSGPSPLTDHPGVIARRNGTTLAELDAD